MTTNRTHALRRSRRLAEMVLDAFGGPTAASRALRGVPITTVDSWRRNGIPAWRWEAIRQAAKRQGVLLPAGIQRAA